MDYSRVSEPFPVANKIFVLLTADPMFHHFFLVA
jgi:hypothetical protein